MEENFLLNKSFEQDKKENQQKIDYNDVIKEIERKLSVRAKKVLNKEPIIDTYRDEEPTFIYYVEPENNLLAIKIMNFEQLSTETLSLLGQLKDLLIILNLCENNLGDTQLEFLSEHTNLEELYLSNNELVYPNFIANLTNLKILNLSLNNIRDISFVKNLKSLEILDLELNKIKDISPLQNLTKLKELNLSQNDIEQINVLSNLTGLKNLYLSANKIKDVSALVNLYLNSIDISFNEIQELPKSFFERYFNYLSEYNLSHNPLKRPPWRKIRRALRKKKKEILDRWYSKH